MSPERSSSRIQRPAQRRPRSVRACNFCRLAKQRCQPSEYGINDRPCRRCVSHDLDCNLSRATRSQSPGSGPGVQGPGLIQHHIAPPSASGPNEEPMPGPEANVQYAQQPDSVGVPMGGWPMPMVHPEERRGSSANSFAPGQIVPGTLGFAPLPLTIEGYHQSYPNVAHGHTDPGLRYYPQRYYEHATASNTYTTNYFTQSANDGETLMGFDFHHARDFMPMLHDRYVERPQPSDDDGSASEQDASLFRRGL